MEIGDRFGKWTVRKKLKNDRVEALCDCGVIKRTRGQYLRDGQSQSCGCGRYADRVAEPVQVGDRFDRLVVIKRLGTNGIFKEALVCCDCGTRKVVREDALRDGSNKSCGCLRRQFMANQMRTHGESHTPLYQTWLSMRERCKRAKRYPTYAGRGIKVCAAWEDYLVFKTYVQEHLGGKPEGYSLDRIDNDRGYEPGNIRWAGPREQASNKSNNVRITTSPTSQEAPKSETRVQAEWARASGLSPQCIYQRRKHGWSDHDAVTIPVQREALTINGKTQLAADWARETGISEALIAMRKLRGFTGADLIAPVQKARTYMIRGEARTLAEWAQVTGLDVKLIDLRLRRGWTEEEAVFGKVKK